MRPQKKKKTKLQENKWGNINQNEPKSLFVDASMIQFVRRTSRGTSKQKRPETGPDLSCVRVLCFSCVWRMVVEAGLGGIGTVQVRKSSVTKKGIGIFMWMKQDATGLFK